MLARAVKRVVQRTIEPFTGQLLTLNRKIADMKPKKRMAAIMLGTGLMYALTGMAGEQSKALNGFTAKGPKLASLCQQRVTDTLDVKSMEFKKVLEIEPLTPGFAILEGPLWVGDRLLMSHVGGSVGDAPNPADFVALRDGELEVIEAGYGANGLALDPSGAVVAARHADGTITRVADGKVIAASFNGARFNSPNDLVISRAGDVYFSDPDWQAPKPYPQTAERTFHVSTSGKVTPFGEGITKPNGVMLSLDQQTLYVGGTNGLFRFKLKESGEVINKAEPVQATLIAGGVDGMSVDCAGNLFVTAEGKIHVLSANSDEPVATFEIPGVNNVAFGGKDGTTVYATTLGEKPQVWVAKSNISGQPF